MYTWKLCAQISLSAFNITKMGSILACVCNLVSCVVFTRTNVRQALFFSEEPGEVACDLYMCVVIALGSCPDFGRNTHQQSNLTSF